MKKIILKEDLNAEVQIFLNFLNNNEYPQHRNIIFSSYPELKDKLESSQEDEKITVEKFLKEVRKNNKENIEKSIIFIKNEIEERGEKTLETTADLMNYKWGNGSEDYFLIPTIFPLSPFNKNTFFFSIYGVLQGIVEYPKVLAVSAHEISHMILFDILKEQNIELGPELLYFIKELIAPVLVYQDDFNECFGKYIVGNYNVLEIYFKDNGKVIKAFDYFCELFTKNRVDKKDFRVFLGEMVSICRKIETEIKEKREFDNRYGMKIMKDLELLEKFREPIKLG